MLWLKPQRRVKPESRLVVVFDVDTESVKIPLAPSNSASLFDD